MATSKPTPIKTELQLSKLKPSDKPFDVRVHYSSGLFVRVGTSGVKSFRWDRGRGQKPRIITYGQHPTISLKEARDTHEQLQQQYKEGVAVEINIDEPKTVQELSERFYAGRIVPNRKRPESVKQVLEHDILPYIGSLRLEAVTTMTVLSQVKRVIDRGSVQHAGKVLAILKQMLGYGVVIGVLEHNAAQPLKKIDLGIGISQRNRVLKPDEINLFWNTLENTTRITAQTRTGLQLLLLLGLRSGELRQAKWEHIDLENSLLMIPVENQKLSPHQAKQGKPFQIPLDDLAISLIKNLAELNSEWLLPGMGGNRPISETSLGKVISSLLVRKIEGELLMPIDKFTPHDLRRTMRSNLSKLGIHPHIAERCLNHSLGGMISVYDQHDYLDERREALECWSQQLQAIVGLKDEAVLLEAV